MMWLVGILGSALLFGLFAALRPRDKGCSGSCIGCTRDGACESRNSAPVPAAGREAE
jgi:hypothetical protein